MGGDLDPCQDVAAETLDQRHALSQAREIRLIDRRMHRAVRQLRENLLDQGEALLDFADADPDARVDVAGIEYGNVEAQGGIGRIARIAAGIEGAPGCPPDVSAAPELPGQLRLEYARADGAILERRRIVVEFNELG